MTNPTTKTAAITNFISGVRAEAVKRIHDGAVAVVITRPSHNNTIDIHQIPFMPTEVGMKAYYSVVNSIRALEDKAMKEGV